jgi:hypothetical protein
LVARKEVNQVVERNYHDVTAHRPQSPPINLHILQKASSGFFLITSSEEKEEENLCEKSTPRPGEAKQFFFRDQRWEEKEKLFKFLWSLRSLAGFSSSLSLWANRTVTHNRSSGRVVFLAKILIRNSPRRPLDFDSSTRFTFRYCRKSRFGLP